MNFSFPYDVIISHGPGCNDGATAAWIVWRTLPEQYRKMLEKEGGFYSAPSQDVHHDNLHPNSVDGGFLLQKKGFPIVFVFAQPKEVIPYALIYKKRVLILDLDLGLELVNVVRNASFVMMIDHHSSSADNIAANSKSLLTDKFSLLMDINKQECGATLTWKYFNGQKVPPFVEIVRIGDHHLWSDRPDLHANFVLKALYLQRAFRSFVDIEYTYQTWSQCFKYYIGKGHSVADHETALVRQAAKQCELGFIQTTDDKIYSIAYTQANILHSEIGENIRYYAERNFGVPIDFCATWKYVPNKDSVSVSLRNPSPNINLSEIAQKVKFTDGKGGGHPDAAGFTFYGIHDFHRFIQRSMPEESIDAEPIGG